MKKQQINFEDVERRLVYGCGFPKFKSVAGKTNIQNIVPRGQKGIYVLSHSDGTFYVGLSVDASNRFEQHVVNKRPIVKYTFLKVRKAYLQDAETEIISLLEDMGVPLTNIEKIRLQKEDFPKPVISLEDRMQWDKSDTWNDLTGKVIAGPTPHSDNEEKYRNVFKYKWYNKDVIDFYSEYVKKCIIKPLKTAPEKWNVSCLRSTSYGIGKQISALNAGKQYLVLIAENKEGVNLLIAAKKSVLKRIHGKDLRELKKLSPSVMVEWRTGLVAFGDDQVEVIVPLKEAKNILKDKGLIRAIRMLAIHPNAMLIKGRSPYTRFHSYSLAKAILSKLKKK